MSEIIRIDSITREQSTELFANLYGAREEESIEGNTQKPHRTALTSVNDDWIWIRGRKTGAIVVAGYKGRITTIAIYIHWKVVVLRVFSEGKQTQKIQSDLYFVWGWWEQVRKDTRFRLLGFGGV